MKKTSLLLAACGILVANAVTAQELSFDELVSLRSMNLKKAETFLHEKGFDFYGVQKGDHESVTFKSHDAKVSYCVHNTNESGNSDVEILYSVTNRADYLAMKKDIKSKTERESTFHMLENDDAIEHLTVDGELAVHFRTINNYKSQSHTYMIEILPNDNDKYVRKTRLRSNSRY